MEQKILNWTKENDYVSLSDYLNKHSIDGWYVHQVVATEEKPTPGSGSRLLCAVIIMHRKNL